MNCVLSIYLSKIKVDVYAFKYNILLSKQVYKDLNDNCVNKLRYMSSIVVAQLGFL